MWWLPLWELWSFSCFLESVFLSFYHPFMLNEILLCLSFLRRLHMVKNWWAECWWCRVHTLLSSHKVLTTEPRVLSGHPILPVDSSYPLSSLLRITGKPVELQSTSLGIPAAASNSTTTFHICTCATTQNGCSIRSTCNLHCWPHPSQKVYRHHKLTS